MIGFWRISDLKLYPRTDNVDEYAKQHAGFSQINRQS
jgi:hypothetical protein